MDKKVHVFTTVQSYVKHITTANNGLQTWMDIVRSVNIFKSVKKQYTIRAKRCIIIKRA